MAKAKKKNKVIKRLSNHRLIVTCIFIMVPIVILCINYIYLLHKIDFTTAMETTYFLSQIIAAVFVIGGTVVAVWQYYLSSKSDMRQTQLVRVQKAIDLSEYYKNEILTKFEAIHYVYDKAGVLKILGNIKTSEMNDFDEKELLKVLDKNNIEKLKTLQKSEVYARAILDADAVFRLNLSKRVKIEETKDGTKVSIEASNLINRFMSNFVLDLLNCMEFWSMHFSHNTADSSVLYRSLHQTYLQIVQEMYYSIADLNKKPESKYYFNVLKLYRKWNEKHNTEIEENRRKLDNGTVVDE